MPLLQLLGGYIRISTTWYVLLNSGTDSMTVLTYLLENTNHFFLKEYIQNMSCRYLSFMPVRQTHTLETLPALRSLKVVTIVPESDRFFDPSYKLLQRFVESGRGHGELTAREKSELRSSHK